MKISSLTYLGFGTNAVLTRTRTSTCPSPKSRRAQAGLLVEHLRKSFGDEADLSIFDALPGRTKAVNSALADAAGCFDGRESRKWRRKKRVLNLVLALIFEAIQNKFISKLRQPRAKLSQPRQTTK